MGESMSWRTSLAGLLAGLSVLAQLPDVPPVVRSVALVVGAVAVAVLGALARDHAAAPPPAAPLDREFIRGELAHMFARASTVPPGVDPPDPDIVRDAAERVLLGSDPPGPDVEPVTVEKVGRS